MRLPRVVAGVTLIVALALVVVPGSVGSQSPSEDPPLDPALLQPLPVAPAAATRTAVTATPDPAHRSAGVLDAGDRLVEPPVRLDAPVRGEVEAPAAAVRVIRIEPPPPPPKPKPKPSARQQPKAKASATRSSGTSTRRTTSGGSRSSGRGSSGGGSSGGATSGGWTLDGHVSWYGPGFYGNRTACGQTYSRSIMGVAHKTLACGTRVTFRNPANGAVVTVPVIDRGPYVAGRNWDLSAATCNALDHCYTGPLQWRFP